MMVLGKDNYENKRNKGGKGVGHVFVVLCDDTE